MAENTRYYYCEDGETSVGPFSPEKVRELLAKEVIDSNVWLCTEGSEEWRIAGDWQEFEGVERLVLLGEDEVESAVTAAPRLLGSMGDVEDVIHSSVLAEAFADFTTEEERARELQRLQRAAARVDLREFRDSETERDQVPTDDDVNRWWFLRYLRLKTFALATAFVICGILLFFYFTRVDEVAEESEPTGTEQQAEAVAEVEHRAVPPVEMGSATSPTTIELRPVAEPEQASRQETEPEVEPENRPTVAPIERPTPSIGNNTAGADAQSAGSLSDPVRTPEFYLLDRRFKITTRQGTMMIPEKSRVKVVNKSVDKWTVEADGLRFEVSPADLRRDNAEGVLTVGTDVSEDETP